MDVLNEEPERSNDASRQLRPALRSAVRNLLLRLEWSYENAIRDAKAEIIHNLISCSGESTM